MHPLTLTTIGLLCVYLEDSCESGESLRQLTKLQQLSELDLSYTHLTAVPEAASIWGLLPHLCSLDLGFDLPDNNDALSHEETVQFLSHVGAATSLTRLTVDLSGHAAMFCGPSMCKYLTGWWAMSWCWLLPGIVCCYVIKKCDAHVTSGSQNATCWSTSIVQAYDTLCKANCIMRQHHMEI